MRDWVATVAVAVYLITCTATAVHAYNVVTTPYTAPITTH